LTDDKGRLKLAARKPIICTSRRGSHAGTAHDVCAGSVATLAIACCPLDTGQMIDRHVRKK